MSGAVKMVEVWRGPFEESAHWGHAVICDGQGRIREAWGDPELVILPRSSTKMIQALPLIEGGYGDELSVAQLAIACASHQGAEVHRSLVTRWLDDLGLGEEDLRCGPQTPRDATERSALIRANTQPCRIHNNCSGKHAGFLMLAQHLGGGAEYQQPEHPVQRAVRAAFEEVTAQTSPGFGVDGCSAPNFACTIAGLAGAMGRYAGARGADARSRAMIRLREAMMQEPLLVAGEGRACTALMRAMKGRVAVKTGAEAVFVAICPELDLGIAVKIVDGGTRAAEAVITALLVRVGALEANHPTALAYTQGPISNWDGLETGRYKVVFG